ncbi:MAG TPA: RagB/SusD family nutrient uptake outer membrane protein [Fodinibius sp.]|nr:RagB/SusD family nutrient uptake outer membrane protein [Fodinibius sp.]
MIKNLNGFLKISLLVLFTFVVSCTDLTENINNEITPENFFQTDEEIISALGDAYSPLTSYGSHGGQTALAEVTSDEIVITQKGADWGDGGIWIRLHRQKFTPSEDEINNAWNNFFSGIANTNRLIFQFKNAVESSANISQEEIDPFIAELRGLRAFYYYLVLDNFGNAPIVTSFEQDITETEQPSPDLKEGRQKLFNFVESELLDVLDLLNTDVDATIGRVNKWVVHMTLAKLYLNAEVYTKTSRWGDVVTHTNAIIDSQNYELMDNYADNFTVNNTGSPEHIFTIPFDEVFRTGFGLPAQTMHLSSQPAFNFGFQPNNGVQTMTDFYESYIDPEQNPGPQGEVIGLDPQGSTISGTVDDRLDNFLVGPLLDLEGNQISDPGASSSDPNGPPITHTPYINELEPDGWRQAGARIAKYEMEIGLSSNNMNNDMIIFRYADVLMMKAEALWRLNGSDPEALELVNRIRERANVEPFNTLDADKILAERGREFFYEMMRRQDLIRFEGKTGKTRFNDAWWEKGTSEPFRNVFPIPQNQLEANPNLKQNPGY